jgi:hypothetical protein
MKFNRLIYGILLLGMSFISFISSQESSKVTGELKVLAHEASFEKVALRICLYEYLADFCPTPVILYDELKVRNFSHLQGKETLYSFVIGSQKKVRAGMYYYVTVHLYKKNTIAPENIIFVAESDTDASGSVLTAGAPNHLSVVAKKTGEYLLQEESVLPQLWTATIPEYEYLDSEPPLSVKVLVQQEVYQLREKGKTKEEQEKILQEAQKNMKTLQEKFPVPEIKIFFQIENTSKETFIFSASEGDGERHLTLSGPGAYLMTLPSSAGTFKSGEILTLEPGQTTLYPIFLLSGHRNSVRHYWTTPGDYLLEVRHRMTRKDRKGVFQEHFTILSPEILLKVEMPQ